MRILVTNDDGIHARGIHALVKELSSIAEIYMVAPDRERSGTGHSITVFEPIKVTPVTFQAVKKAWIIGGTPVDCVKLAISKLVDVKLDLVVSGINHGPNLGTDVLYSGTVSAAAEGVIMGIPSVAVSLDSFDADMDFRLAARTTRKVVELILEKGINSQTLLNINIPALPKDEIKGIRITKLGVRNYDNLFDERQDPRGNTYYWLGGGVINEEQEKDSDVIAVQEAFISITPINLDLTDYRLIKEYEDNFKSYLDFTTGVKNDFS
ncbi:MAG: 5'/3'-nucleotidase SurE [Syntrophomonadaceae bacterium]|nr:5'/3'-nucleotidase SurE [Syntrophomonadaceae bacterium]MDD4549447.1 5'/3'-nucleotidase SurE [Syntrophomonadaceae bacterium]